MDRIDFVALSALRVMILQEINGDGGKNQGLIRALMSGDWETVVRTRGIVFGYEKVLEMMLEVSRRLNQEDEERQRPQATYRAN